MRIINNDFKKSLKKGILNPLLERVILDASLDLEIRANYINIYYRGGSILRLEQNARSKKYNAKFDFNYFKGTGERDVALPTTISTKFETECWVRSIGHLKNGMDLWFGTHPKNERAFQQILVYDNNGTKTVARNTDYFISDIEYAIEFGKGKKARFDAIALRWSANSKARTLQAGYKPRLTLIEMKYGDSALTGQAGMVDHFNQYIELFNNNDRIAELKSEIIKQFQQKRDLGLIPALEKNESKITKLDNEVDVLFVLANHSPSDKKLRRELMKCQKKDIGFRVLFSQANFHGYGLYEKNMFTMEEFIERELC